MKHAFIITAYHNFDLLQYFLAEYLKEADCYLHIDRKAQIPEEFTSWIQMQQTAGKGLYISRRYTVNWGSCHHLQAVLLLCRMAIQREYDYYHITSGNTFITRPLKDVLAFFETTPNRIYMDVRDLTVVDKEKVMDPWFIYYHFLHFYDKKTALGNNIDWYLCKIQKKLGIHRRRRYRYHGSLYAHYTAESLRYVLEYHQTHPEYYRNLVTCNICEEFFFQNILMYSPLIDSIVPQNYIYCKWSKEGVAEDLTAQDYEAILQGNSLFARKFGADSLELLSMLHTT